MSDPCEHPAWRGSMLRRWRERLRGAQAAPAAQAARALRWVVLDVETSGLDEAHDRLVSIGAVAVHDRRIVVADSLELTLRQARASRRENILVHGIGQEAQHAGLEPRMAMQRFVDYIGPSPLLAFHASFDRAFLMRAASAWLEGLAIGNLWIDAAGLARALVPDCRARALDEWLDEFGIVAEQRHNAGADAFVTAMLFLRLLAIVPEKERDPRRLQRIAANARWLGR